jgi:hypothetical protein
MHPVRSASRRPSYERPPAHPPAPAPRPGTELASIAPPGGDRPAAEQRLNAAQEALKRLAAQNRQLREQQAKIDLARAQKDPHRTKDMNAAIALDDESLKLQQALDRNVAAWTAALHEFVAAKASLHTLDRQKPAKAIPVAVTAPAQADR